MPEEENSTQTEKKKWDKVNASPGTSDILKRIALDEKKHIYQVLDDLIKEKYQDKYSEYFRKNRKNAV